MFTIRFALLALIFLSGYSATLAHADSVEGRPDIVDADTVVINGEKIRFKHVDAPETKQVCQDGDGYDYQCGEVATEALRQKIGDRPIRCDLVGKVRMVALLENAISEKRHWVGG